MLRIKEFGSKLYTTHLIGFNEKYRYLFFSCNTRFVIYSLDLEKIIVETKELRWVENMTFTADWNYAVCRTFKTASSQQADAYLIKMNELKDGFAYEFIDRVVCDAVWNCSRFPSAIILANKNKIKIVDCNTKKIIMSAENKFFLKKLLFLQEGEEEDVLEVTYLGIDSKEYYRINSETIQFIPEMKEFEERYSAWKRYHNNRMIVQSRFHSGGILIKDQINKRYVILEKEKLALWEGQLSLSGDYFWTIVVRDLDEDEYITYSMKKHWAITEIVKQMKAEYEKKRDPMSKETQRLELIKFINEEEDFLNENDTDLLTGKMYSALFNLKTQEVVHLVDDSFEVWGISAYGYDEKTGLIFFEEALKQYSVSIFKLEDSDYINQSLNEIDFRKLQPAITANDEFCESILFKGH